MAQPVGRARLLERTDNKKYMEEITNIKYFGKGLIEPLYNDPRNIPLSSINPILGAEKLPSEHFADISQLNIHNQLRTGSCVGQATALMKEYQELQEDKVVYFFSPRFIYALCKKIDNYDGWGTYIQTGVKVAKLFGSVIQEKYFPEDTHLPDEEFRDWKIIPRKAFDAGKNFRTSGYAYAYRKDLNAIKTAFINHDVLVGGVNLSNNGFRVNSDGMVRAPLDGEKIFGHSIMFFGYSTMPDGKTALWFRNSWGKNWGNNGNAYLIYEDYKPLFDMWSSTDLPSELINKAKSMIPLIQGDKRPEVYAHNTKKGYKAWVNQEVLLNWMGQLWGEDGWDIGKLMKEYVRIVPQAEINKLPEVDLFVGKVVA